MGFFFVVAWAGSAILIGGPAVAIAVVLWTRAGGRRCFVPVGIAAALFALAGRIALLLDASIVDGGVPVWPTLFAMLFHVPLLLSLPLAGTTLLGLRLPASPGRQIVTGIGAGLAVSIPLQIAGPLLFGRLVSLLGLRPIY
jgi:hypothetical protein